MDKINELFNQELKVINMGLESFADELKQQGVEVVHVNWKPPAGGNARLAAILNKLK
jgi:deoxyribodipyrimidine photolyase-like uncharacterized protein